MNTSPTTEGVSTFMLIVMFVASAGIAGCIAALLYDQYLILALTVAATIALVLALFGPLRSRPPRTAAIVFATIGALVMTTGVVLIYLDAFVQGISPLLSGLVLLTTGLITHKLTTREQVGS